MGFKFSKKINFDIFINNNTKESVYLLGLMWADGTINKKRIYFLLNVLKKILIIFILFFKRQVNMVYTLEKEKIEKFKELLLGHLKSYPIF
jgi:hypothetical protein